jgi:hypothetical protein
MVAANIVPPLLCSHVILILTRAAWTDIWSWQQMGVSNLSFFLQRQI